MLSISEWRLCIWLMFGSLAISVTGGRLPGILISDMGNLRFKGGLLTSGQNGASSHTLYL